MRREILGKHVFDSRITGETVAKEERLLGYFPGPVSVILMNSTHKIQHGLIREFANLDWKDAYPNSLDILTVMLRYIAQYRSFYRSYLKTRPVDPMATGFQEVYEKYLKAVFHSVGVTDEGHMGYYCRFCRAGLSSVVGAWLEKGCPEPPEEPAGLLDRILSWPAQSR